MKLKLKGLVRKFQKEITSKKRLKTNKFEPINYATRLLELIDQAINPHHTAVIFLTFYFAFENWRKPL